MRSLVLSVVIGAACLPAVSQSVEETEKAVDCLALTEVATANRSVPDTAQLREWRGIVAASPFCQKTENGPAYRAEEYRKALRDADLTSRFALELLIESEAEKCVTGAATTDIERGV